MSGVALQDSAVWFLQAGSDVRTAHALLAVPHPLLQDDVGCHVAAMCAQSIEKSLKGYLLLNGATPAMNHRPDKYLANLLSKGDPLLRHEDHHSYLSNLFDAATKATVRWLFDVTPGGQGSHKDLPNTEYPWGSGGDWRYTPYGNKVFADPKTKQDWVLTAKRIHDLLFKLWIAVDRGTAR